MKTRIILLFIIVVFTFNMANAQTNTNDYKYVIVPNTFDFLSEPDQYRLNTLTKLLLEKYGFITIMENDKLPDDAISNTCLALKANVLKESGAFKSKLKVELKNCKSEVIFTSNLGTSREKSYQVAYTLALREAFKSFDTFKYQYNENIIVNAKKDTQKSNDEIEKLKKEIKILKEEKETVVEVPKEILEVNEVVEKGSVTEMLKDKKEMQSKNNDFRQELTKKTYSIEPLFAHPITNGYLLMDSDQKEVMVLYKTGKSDFYIVKGKDAIVYRRIKNIWLYLDTNEEKYNERPIVIEF